MPDSLPESQRLGPWALDAEIGRGGMGVVWAAHRADGSFEQQVAIKLLPPLFASPLLRNRFERETQALARLSHPNIARLFDAGQTADGTAWLAMERVHGESLTRHVHEQQVGLRGRLALLLQLCDAVTHAHRHLLVHRDLKPGNVLVTPAGQVKLLDFGVVWLLDEADSTRLTQGIGAFTPGYASPEQTDSTDVSTAADVFALGVLLYELITDSHPFIHSGDTLSRTLQRTLHESPLAPSRQKTALSGVDADLDAITLHALQKQAQDRLASPEALARELRAWLAGEAVASRAPKPLERAGKWLRRNQLLAATAALGMVGTLGFAAVSAWHARLAQARFEQVRALASHVVHDYNALLEPIAGTLAVRQRILADALTYLDALSSEAADHPALLAEVAEGYVAIGDVQGRGVANGNLGDLDGASLRYARAATLYETLCYDGPKTSAACQRLGQVRERQGDLLAARGLLPQATTALHAAAQALGYVSTDSLPQAEQAPHLERHARLLTKLGSLAGRGSGAVWESSLSSAQTQLQLVEQMVALQAELPATAHGEAAQALARRDAARADAQRLLAQARLFLANRWNAVGQSAQGLPLAQAGESLLRERAGSDQPGASLVDVMEWIGAAQTLSDSLLLQARHDEAADVLEPAWQRVQAMQMAEPDNLPLRGRVAQVGRRLAAAQRAAGNAGAAVQTAAAAVAVSHPFGPEHSLLIQQRWYAAQEAAEALLALGDPDAARPLAEQAATGLAEHWAQGQGGERMAVNAAQAALVLAKVARAQGEAAESAKLADQALAWLQPRVASTPRDAEARYTLARLWHERAGDFLLLSRTSAEEAARLRDDARAQLASNGEFTPHWQAALQPGH